MTRQDDAAPQLAETHISLLFFVGDRVYKLKKPVKYSFIDQSTRELRERACHREVDLNRRLAPDVYLGVLDVFDAAGAPVEHLVEMRRLPADRRLSTMVTLGRDVRPCLRQLARDIAAFHAAGDSSPEIIACASLDTVRQRWHNNLTELERFAGDVLDVETLQEIRRVAGRYLDGRGTLFASRVTSRHARDGHGDLLADDIFCLDDGPRALDCIEFDDQLRWADVIADVAFLAMDLERIGARDLADRFLEWYREFSGESYPQSLADFYIAYRAAIRSKVACLKHAQGDGASRDRARALLDLSRRRLEHGRVRLVLVGGLPGTGKSTLAGSLSARTGWALLRSDEVRKDVTATPHIAHHAHRMGEGIYSEEATRRTYSELLDRAATLLGYGESVILDASWVRAADRGLAASVAAGAFADLVALRCELDASIAAERMRRRETEGTDPSDADAAVAKAMAATADPWPEAVAVSTVAPPDDVTRGVCRDLGIED
jgi:aminoglycoside phosphotransferase family enzyme/predicted kinase